MGKKKNLIVIGGPTASGKTTLAIELAQHFDTEIVSADSRQFYKEMNIGTAKPTNKELSAIPHHFIGHLSIEETYSAGQFEREALEKINALFTGKDWVILVGGSGLFLKAITEGLDDFPDVPPVIRDTLNQELVEKGIEFLQRKLAVADPDFYQQIDRNNPRRIIRALEVIQTTGKPISVFRKGKAAERSFQCIFIQPHWPRSTLYDRINLRVEQMFAAGLESEAKQLSVQQLLPALQTVGYQELFDYFDKKIDLEQAKDLIKQNSRRYAKRQLTWARQTGQWFLLAQPFASAASKFLTYLSEGWKWQVEHKLEASTAFTVEEERISKYTFTNNEIEGYFILAKQPRFSQAVITYSKDYPKAMRALLINQLLMRSTGFPLYLWSAEPLENPMEYGLEIIQVQGAYPFSNWVDKKDKGYKYKKSN